MRRLVQTLMNVGMVLLPAAVLAQSTPPNARTAVIEDAVLHHVRAKIIDGCKLQGWRLLDAQPNFVVCSSSERFEGERTPPGAEWQSATYIIRFELSERDGDVTAVANPWMLLLTRMNGRVLSSTNEVRVGKVYDETLRILGGLGAE
jgi:hypothetical protein